MIMAAMGAEIIKIEQPGIGDSLRLMLPEGFEFLNKGKRSVVIDLKTVEGKKAFLRLAKDSKVIIEGFRPGTAARLGIDFESTRSINPGVIYVSLSGFGQDGPYAGRPGHDVDFQAVSGLVSITGDPESEKGAPAGFQASGIAGGMFALVSILGALLGKKTNPSEASEAIYLDISITDSLVMWMVPRMAEYFSAGSPPRSEFMARGSYGVFQARDGRQFSLGAVEEHFWTRLCSVLDLHDLLEDPELRTWKGRNKNHKRIFPRLCEIFLTQDRDTWLSLLQEADIPAFPVHELKDVLADPQIRHRRILGVDDGKGLSPHKTKPFPVPQLIKDTENDSAPELGQDTCRLLMEAGYTLEEVRALNERGIVWGKGCGA